MVWRTSDVGKFVVLQWGVRGYKKRVDFLFEICLNCIRIDYLKKGVKNVISD